MNIKETIRQYMLNNFLFTDDPSVLNDDTSFLEQGIIDSTGVMELVAFLEDTFGIAVSDEDMVPENLDSVDRVNAYVIAKQTAAKTA